MIILLALCLIGFTSERIVGLSIGVDFGQEVASKILLIDNDFTTSYTDEKLRIVTSFIGCECGLKIPLPY